MNLENALDVTESDYINCDLPAPTNKEIAAQGIKDLYSLFPRAKHTFFFKSTERNFTPVHSDPNAALRDCLAYNSNGYDIYFMVNEGDGITHPPKTTCRSQQSVVSLTSCFIDADGCPYEDIKKYLSSINLVPHLVILSSSEIIESKQVDRYHVYFKITPTPKTNSNIEKWTAVQNILMRLGDSDIVNPVEELHMDKTMNDYAKLLRVPGFKHIGKKTIVTIKEQNDIPAYSLEDLYALTKAERVLKITNEYGTLTHSSFKLDDTKVYGKGERWEAQRSMALRIANLHGVDDDYKRNVYFNWVNTNISHYDNEYLCNGELTYRSKDLIEKALKKVNSERLEQELERQASLAASEKQGYGESQFVLPDSFFTEEPPNGFGDVVKDALQAAMYPSAHIMFGILLGGFSYIKSAKYLNPYGQSIALYVLAVGTTGRGKNDPQAFILNTMNDLGLGKEISNDWRSDQGMNNHLGSTGGRGYFHMDEIGVPMEVIQNPKAASHEKKMLSNTLKYYSGSTINAINCGKIGSTGRTRGPQNEEIILKNVTMGLVGCTTPDTFMKMFDESSLKCGLFSRFISIVAPREDRVYNPNCNLQHIIKSPLLPDKVDLINPTDIEGVPDIQNKPEQTKIRMGWDKGAKEYYESIIAEYDAEINKLNRSNNKDDHLLAIVVTRLAENLLRMACTLSISKVEKQALEYCKKFTDNNYQATRKILLNDMIKGEGNERLKLEKTIIDKVADFTREAEYVSTRDLYTNYAVNKEFKSKAHFDAIVKELVAVEKLIETNNFIKDKNAKKLRKCHAIKLGNIW